jgi:fatty acid omega-hydroxylase
MEEGSKSAFAVSFDAVQVRMLQRFIVPWWQLEEKLTSVGKAQRAHIKVLRDFGSQIINTRREQMRQTAGFSGSDAADTTPTITKGPTRSTIYGDSDLLSLLMKLKTDDGKDLDDNTLIDYLMNFIIAGRDTTASALSWTFFLLNQYPQVREKLVKEIDETLGDAYEPTYDQIKSMAYANAVFHETLRIFPPVPEEVKQAVADDIWPDGTTIKKGTLVSWSPYAMGRTEAIWGHDAKQFRPERWLEMKLQPSPFAYSVFNSGPRVCLGKQMAELEGVFVMVSILRKFRIVVQNPENVTYAISATLPIKGGLKARIFNRSC